MKAFIIVVIIIFSLQSSSKANDIRDFEIEGISIGDSLLDYFSKSNIDKEIRSEFSYKYKNNRFVGLGVGQTKEFSLFKKLKQFDEVGVTINPSDKNYIVQGLSGEMLCHNNIEKCMVSKDDIINDLKNSFEKIVVDSWERKHPIDKTGKSTVYGNTLKVTNLDFSISVSVYDMSDDEFNDSVKVSIRNKEFANFIKYEAYQ
tara:strand:- start:18085 stop:18690 length:606 start_codon:yes stop_codon:yes gene_type:complete